MSFTGAPFYMCILDITIWLKEIYEKVWIHYNIHFRTNVSIIINFLWYHTSIVCIFSFTDDSHIFIMTAVSLSPTTVRTHGDGWLCTKALHIFHPDVSLFLYQTLHNMAQPLVLSCSPILCTLFGQTLCQIGSHRLFPTYCHFLCHGKLQCDLLI